MRSNEPKGERKNMKMTFRWYGSQSDKITLKQIKQIPGCTGLMGVLDYKAAGEVWEEDEIKAYIDEVHAAGLECEVIESVNVHEDIKLGLPTRDQYIENYCKSIRNLAKYGVKVIVYNFMPVLDWLRTDLARVIPEDGSNSLYYDEAELGAMTPMEIVRRTAETPTASPCRAGSPPVWPSWSTCWSSTRAWTRRSCLKTSSISSTASSRPAKRSA